MIITKFFEVESAHIVRNCTSERCSHSIHGHSAKIEISFTCDSLDNAQMVYDFGLMKGSIKDFIDSMDHCYLLCSKEKEGFQEFIKKECDRYIVLPFNPSAEMLSLYILNTVDNILHNTVFANGESGVRVHSVRYWETRTGSATVTVDDMGMYSYTIDDVEYSDSLLKEHKVLNSLKENLNFTNPKVNQQISF